MARKVSAAVANIQWVTHKNTTAPSAPASGYVAEWWKGGAPWVTRPDGSSAPTSFVSPIGRLTLESGVPVSVTDQTAKATLYYTAGALQLYDGTADWNTFQHDELSLSLGGYTTAKPYDIWAYNNSGSVALASTVWTNATTRATALAWQNGRLVKSDAKGYLLLGTIYTSAAGQTQMVFNASGGFIGVSNVYNRVAYDLFAVDTTNSWSSVGTATWRQANGAAANKVEYVDALGYDSVSARAVGLANSDGSQTTAAGIGLDSTSANSARTMTGGLDAYRMISTADYGGKPGAGYHYLAWLEITSGATTFYGDNGLSYVQTGLTARVMA